MRLFTAIELSEVERRRLATIQMTFARTSSARMTPPGNLHLTLRFFGDWPDARLGELESALDALPRPKSAFSLRFGGLRFLPGRAAPRVFIALFEAHPRMLELQRGMEECARDLGMSPEQRAFIPHITLARIRDARQGRRLVEAVSAAPVDGEPLNVGGFSLIASDLRGAQPMYSSLRTWRFANQAPDA